MNQAIDSLRKKLAPFPANRAAFDHCIDHFVARPGLSLAVSGSLVSGDLDPFSDLDLIMLAAPELELPSLQEEVNRVVPRIGHPLAVFQATHLNLPNLHIFYLAVDDWVVKIDFEVYSAANEVQLPAKLLVLHDPSDQFASMEKVPLRDQVDFISLQQKFCGWLWYSYTKIRRGEFFQAARSIEYTREHAVLPCLLRLKGLTQDGHRRIEERLSRSELERLYASHPAKLEHRELMRALFSTADHFLDLQKAMKTAFPESKPADIQHMLDLIKSHEA